jgi:hypothetical protein
MHKDGALAGVPEKERCMSWANKSGCGVKAVSPTCHTGKEVAAHEGTHTTTAHDTTK